MNGVHRITHNHLSPSISPLPFLLHSCRCMIRSLPPFPIPFFILLFTALFFFLLPALHLFQLSPSLCFQPISRPNIFQSLYHHLSLFFPFLSALLLPSLTFQTVNFLPPSTVPSSPYTEWLHCSKFGIHAMFVYPKISSSLDLKEKPFFKSAYNLKVSSVFLSFL